MRNRYASTSSDECDTSSCPLSPPSYTLQEDEDGNLFNPALQLVWPERPTHGRYSLEELLFYKKRRGKNSKRTQRDDQRTRHSRSSTMPPMPSKRTSKSSNCVMMIPKQISNCRSVDSLVPTSLLLSSSVHTRPSHSATSSTHGVGGIQLNSSDCVPTVMLDSECYHFPHHVYRSSGDSSEVSVDMKRHGSSASDILVRSSLIFADDVSRATNISKRGPTLWEGYKYMGACRKNSALEALNFSDFVIFYETDGNYELDDDELQLKIGINVDTKKKLFDLNGIRTEDGGIMWNLGGLPITIGFNNLLDMTRFYSRFPQTLSFN